MISNSKLVHPAIESESTSTPTTSQKPYLVIEPAKGWRSLRLRDVWEFRDLLFTLGMRDVKLIYKQTLLGVAWVVLQPLIGAAIFTFVFGFMANMPSGKLPYFLFAFAGMLSWTLFSTTVTNGSLVMINNSQLVSKIYFPRLILPLSSAFQPLVNFSVGLVLMAILLAIYHVPPTMSMFFLPVATALLVMLSLGIAFWTSAVTVRYRDLRYVVPVAIQFALFASPIGYGLAALNEKVPTRYQFFYMLNPLASLMEFFRWSVFGEGKINGWWLAYSVLVSVAIFFGGAFAFRRSERAFADVI